MKKFYILVFCLFIFIQGFAQSNFDLSFEAIKDGSHLKIEYFIEKTSGSDFYLGASDLPLIKTNDNFLNWSQIQLDPAFSSPFTLQGNPTQYSSPLVSAQNFVNLTILPKPNSGATGVMITNSKTKIASLLIPITGQCAESNLVWETQLGALNSYRTDGQTANIKPNANFVNLSNNTIRLFDVPSKPTVTLVDSASACEGNSVGLITSSSAFDLSWLKDGVEIGGADTLFMASASGLYQSQLENCSFAELSDPVQVTILPAPEKAIITEDNGILYSSVTDNIQWYRNKQPLFNQNSPTLIPTSTGVYTVKSTNICGEAISEPFNFNILSVDNEHLRLDLKAFPNPYIGSTNIVVTIKEATELRVEVYDLKGNLVSLVKEGFVESGVYEMTFSAQKSGWSAGTYILKVRSGDKEITQNLVELK